MCPSAVSEVEPYASRGARTVPGGEPPVREAPTRPRGLVPRGTGHTDPRPPTFGDLRAVRIPADAGLGGNPLPFSTGPVTASARVRPVSRSPVVALARCEGGRHTTVPAPGDGPSTESPMSSLSTPASDPGVTDPAAEALQRRFLVILPVIERHGRVCFGRLRCRHRLEEALAEMAALAWKWFLRMIEQGKDAA